MHGREIYLGSAEPYINLLFAGDFRVDYIREAANNFWL